MLIGVVAQPILAGDKYHRCRGDLGHEGCIMIWSAHHALGGCSQSIGRSLNGVKDLQNSEWSSTGQQAVRHVASAREHDLTQACCMRTRSQAGLEGDGWAETVS